LDSAQIDSVLRARSAAVADDLIIVCATAAADGSVHLAGGVTHEALVSQIFMLRNSGVRVKLGLTFGGGPGAAIQPTEASRMLADPSWRLSVIEALTSFDADGYELAFPQFANASRKDLVAFAQALSTQARPARTVGVFAPPSAADPSDLPGGDAYDLRSLRPHVDRVRLMTLDFSCCGSPPGPTLDPLWASNVAFQAIGKIPEAMVDVAIPLYGVHFEPAQQRYISHAQALALSVSHQVVIQRTDQLIPHFQYRDNSQMHDVWFDDATSTLSYLASWRAPSIPASVGVVYYGLGSEDGSLWSSIAEANR
jgi:spore germination protein YaaH